jgi:hypothetical protein
MTILNNKLVRALFLVASAVTAAAVSSGARADSECRDPTPAEKQVIYKLATAVKKTVVEPLLARGWIVESQESAFESLNVASHPDLGRPIKTCTSVLSEKLTADPRSARGQELARNFAALSAGTSVQDARKLARAMQSASLEISVEANEPYLGSPLSDFTPLSIPGVPLSYRVPARIDKESPDFSHLTLCFGNWTHFGTDRYVPYPFAHPGRTPFIENACIHVNGLPETLDELIKQVTWGAVEQGLTAR